MAYSKREFSWQEELGELNKEDGLRVVELTHPQAEDTQ